MPYFALVYDVVHDYVARRAAYRAEHLALASAWAGRGELVLGGLMGDPNQAVIVFRVPDRAGIERFVAEDPYVRNGLVTAWTIRPWTVVVGTAYEGQTPGAG